MTKVFVFAVALCVALTAGYDFKDSGFNEVILRDLLDLTEESDSSVLHRIVRAAEGAAPSDECKGKKKDRGFHCCSDKIDSKHLELIKGAKKECLAELHGNDSEIYFKFDPFTCEKLEELKKDVTCVAECVGRKFGLLDDSGNVNRDAFLAHLKMKLQDSEWKLKAADSIVDKCIAETKKEVENHVAKRDVASEKTCNPASLKLSQCLWREFVRACPKDLQVDSPKCNKLREKIEKGDAVSYKGFYLRHLNDDK